uniref:Reverse transcriptase domain-containing protein n=1 Tax=Ciona savignyi TaxID=51511 RepID=H2YWZ5_CIOSA
AKPHNVSIIQCYAPTSTGSEEEMEIFYNTLQETIDSIPSRDVKLLMGDFNAKVGSQNISNSTLGRYGLGQLNERGENLVEFCSTNNLSITNTMFKHHPRHLYTWVSPDQKTRNQIDYILLGQKWRSAVKNVRTRPGADCNSDHQLLAADIKFNLKKLNQPQHPIRLDYKTLDENYRVEIENKFAPLLLCEEERSTDDLWNEGKETIIKVAAKTIKKKTNKSSNWISDETLKEIKHRREIKPRRFDSPVDEALYKKQNAKVQKMMRKDKERYIEQQCEKIEENAAHNSTKELYQSVKKLTKSFKPSADTVKSENGAVLCDRDDIKERWKEYCSKLYKRNEKLPSFHVELSIKEPEPPPLIEEVIEAIKDLKNDKSPGADEVTAELIKNGGPSLEAFYHKLCCKIWNDQKWPADWVKSVFVPIPKKGDTLQCTNNRTIALISHSSKILLKIIAKRMLGKMEAEIAEEQAGFKAGTGTRNQILNLNNAVNTTEICLSVLLTTPRLFDSVAHDILWKNMQDMGFSDHIILLLKTMYGEQKAAVRTTYGLSDWFGLGQGVRQGCIVSPKLFNVSEAIMRNSLDDFVGTVKVSGHIITNLRYADDVALTAGSMEELQELVDRVRIESEKSGLFLNAKKTKVMKIIRTPDVNDETTVKINNEPIENVKHFTYLGVVFTDTYDDSVEIKRRIAIAKNATVALTKIWKDRNIRLTTKKRLLASLVFSIATYGAECWSLKQSDKKRIVSFELWCFRRLLRVSWTEKKTNEEILQRINCDRRLTDMINERKLEFIGHILRRDHHLDNVLLTGMVYGPRGRGRPKTRYWDDIRQLTGLGVKEAIRLAQNRIKWRRLVKRATASH